MRRMAGIERSRFVYFAAGAGTRAFGVVLRARIFKKMGGGLVGRRAVALPRQAQAAARKLQS